MSPSFDDILIFIFSLFYFFSPTKHSFCGIFNFDPAYVFVKSEFLVFLNIARTYKTWSDLKKNVAKTNQHYLDKYRQNKAVEVNY